MHIDLEARTISVSVTDLVSAGRAAPASRLSRLRARLGVRTHERYQQQRLGDAGETIECEVPVTFDREIDGYHATVRGRIDVLITAERASVVEEVKSVIDGVEAAKRFGDEMTTARLQARLYALAIDPQDGSAVVARVVLVPVTGELDGASHAGDTDASTVAHTIDAGYQRDATLGELDAALRQLIREAAAQADELQRRAAAAERLLFPFPEQRPHQAELGEAIESALEAGRPVLANAPTGIGKTVSALLPALRHALRSSAQLVYLTAKTTQRTLVASTFLDIVRASEVEDLRALTLRARAGMCPPGDLNCHPDACPLLAHFAERAEEGQVADELLAAALHLDPDDIYAHGTRLTLCPYELSMEVARRVDLLIGDYNHVFDNTAQPRGLQARSQRVVIIDEAHNLFDRARGYYSPFVSTATISRLERSLMRRDIEMPEALSDDIERLCGAVREAIDEASRRAGDEAAPFEGCTPVDLDAERWRQLADATELAAMRHAHFRYKSGVGGGGADPMLELANEVSKTADLMSAEELEMIGYAASRDSPNGSGAGIICADPSRRLELQHRSACGTIAMSATMTPLTYFSDVLGLTRLDPLLTSAPSPFPHEHRRVLVVPSVDTTYRERDHHAADIGALISRMVQLHPGRYIAFFPSFAYLGTVQRYIELGREQVLVQPPASSSAVRKALLTKLKQRPGTTLLLAVLGGVFAEGIDLPGEQLIGAFVVGPGLPPVSFERLVMQHYFDERYEAGFAYAMVYPGLQRVVQAAGRVIRTMEDKGAIVLLGRRFADPAYSECLPPDWYRYSAEELISEYPIDDLEQFWDSLG